MNKEFLFTMLSTPSVSGREEELQKKVIAYMKDTADEIRTDATGNVISLINPQNPIRVLLSGHIDEIGLILTQIQDDGMLKAAQAGGIHVSQYLGHKVRVCTENEPVYGAVLTTGELQKNKELRACDLTIDIGVSTKAEAMALVQVGDPVIFDTDYREMAGGKLCARALDDRSGAFIILETLRRLKEQHCSIGVYAVTAVGEETTRRGAYFASEEIKPSFAIAVDVTYATDYPGTSKAETGDVSLGGGPVICHGSLNNRALNRMLFQIAQKEGIPIQEEVAVGYAGTDADVIHFTNEGVPTALVSLPLRYMHSPDEVASWSDIEACIQLLTAFLLSLTEQPDLRPVKSDC